MALGAAVTPGEWAGGVCEVCYPWHGDADIFRMSGVSACGASGGGIVYRADFCAADLALCLWPRDWPCASERRRSRPDR